MSIKSFACKETEKIWERTFSNKLPSDIQRLARRKLIMIHASSKIEDFQVPPGNKFQSYCGKKKRDKFSIRINDQWRICFYFSNGDATEVEIVDYH